MTVRHRWFALAAVAALALGVATVAALPRATAHQPATDEVRTAPVLRTDLSYVQEFSGALGYGAARTLKGRTTGMVTWLPAPGATVNRGQPLYRVDEKPVTLFFGITPLYRTLDKPGLTGADVRVVRQNLVALGHGAGDGADDEFTSGTVKAVKRWQRASGRVATGVLGTGDVVVLPGAVRVATIKAQLADPADGELMSVTSTGRAVTVAVDATQLDALKVGVHATVLLPTGVAARGTVRAISSAALNPPSEGLDQSPSDGQAKVDVVVTLDDPAKAGSLASGPVRVQFVATTRKAVLAVPLTALMALREGGYAVELKAGAKRTLVAVKTGLFAKGLVEVSGPGIAEGQHVVVTS